MSAADTPLEESYCTSVVGAPVAAAASIVAAVPIAVSVPIPVSVAAVGAAVAVIARGGVAGRLPVIVPLAGAAVSVAHLADTAAIDSQNQSACAQRKIIGYWDINTVVCLQSDLDESLHNRTTIIIYASGGL